MLTACLFVGEHQKQITLYQHQRFLCFTRVRQALKTTTEEQGNAQMKGYFPKVLITFFIFWPICLSCLLWLVSFIINRAV